MDETGYIPPSVEKEIPRTVEEIKHTCETGPRQFYVQHMYVENPQIRRDDDQGIIGGCDWGKNGNLNPLAAHYQARAEQLVSLELPSNGVLCGLSAAIPPSQQKKLTYSDLFVITFNEYVLASSVGLSNILDLTPDGILQYQWENKLAGSYSGLTSPSPYCLGGGKCVMPVDDREGTLDIEFPADSIYKIFSNVSSSPNKEIRFITAGDRGDRDCYHEPLFFDVKMEYVIP